MLLQHVRQFVRQHALVDRETRVVVALSGGSDSVALTALLGELDAAGELRLVGAAHFNHRLRAEADRDEQFCAALARSLDLPFVVDREDVGARARRGHRSLEVAGREARYEFFERVRRQCSADVVALGHTRDDQAETVLLRLVRGAGLRGLAAIYPRHGSIIRPLLDCRRMELRAYLDQRHLEYVEDETNRDVSIPRNRVRAELLPLLIERFNRSVVDVLAHEAELARETWEWLESEAIRFEDTSAVTAAASVPTSPAHPVSPAPPAPVFRELSVDKLRQAPAALRRLVIWRAMNAVAGGRMVSFAHVEAALELLETDGQTLDAPGQRVQRLGSRLVLLGRPRGTGGRRFPNPGTLVNLFEYPLSIPGEVQVAEAGCTVSAEVVSPEILSAENDVVWTEIGAGGGARVGGTRSPVVSGKGPQALVRQDLCRHALVVRNRRAGDHFRPVGLGGRKTLQDYFVDRKVAREERGLVPLVVDETDRIVWVAGYGIDEAFRVTDASQSMLLLRLKLLGGCA